jgi:putative peptide zinc metalloprotease protein
LYHLHPGGDRAPGGPRQPLSRGAGHPGPYRGRPAPQPADTVPLARIRAPEEGWIADYYRRLRLAAVTPADAAIGSEAAIQGELLYLRSWASRAASARLALPAPRTGEARRDDIGGTVPRLAPGVEQLGEYQGSGLTEATYLVRHPGGQVMQLSRLLHLVLTGIDGSHTVAEIAEQVSAAFGRTVSVGNIEFLLANKLIPLGLLDTGVEAGPTGAQQPGPALLALKLRFTIVPAAGVQYLARLFKPLFYPPVVVVLLACLIVSDTWLFRDGRLAPAVEYVLFHPLLLLVALGLALLSTAFHECGHAAACRYGGARPGVIGVGFYVLWPAFFTNVTDAYRLGRAGRIRTDLGGVYFNSIFVLAMTVAYRATGDPVLVAAVMITHVEIVQQLMPSLRFDGYFILADLIGVPDLFRRIGPTLRGLIPGQPKDPRVHDLKRPARLGLTAWVMVIVPLLATELILIILNIPLLARTVVRSINDQAQILSAALGRSHVAAGLLAIISIVLLALPMAGLAYILLRTIRTAFRRTVAATRGRPARRFVAAVVSLAVVAGLAIHWGALGLLPLRTGGATPSASAAGNVTIQRPAPSASAGSRGGAARSSRRAAVLDPVSAAGFDALESKKEDPGDENSAAAKFAIDGNPATAWSTQYYLGSALFGGLKSGTGLILDMGNQVRISTVTVTFGSRRGADVSIEVGNDDTRAAATLSTFTTVARADDVGGRHTFRATRSAKGRYVLIWFTKLPPLGSGRFAAEIFNVVVRGWG